jgi:ABC-type transporter Mla subunit MlaD
MKRNLSDYLVALSVIACSVVLLGALTFALSGYRLKKPTRTLQINYEDVTGIKVNSEVRYAGAPAGRVISLPKNAKQVRTRRTPCESRLAWMKEFRRCQPM